MPILKQKDRTDQNIRAERERKEDLEPQLSFVRGAPKNLREESKQKPVTEAGQEPGLQEAAQQRETFGGTGPHLVEGMPEFLHGLGGAEGGSVVVPLQGLA